MSSPPPRRRQIGEKTLPGDAAPPDLTMAAPSMRAGHGKGKQPRNSRARPDDNATDDDDNAEGMLCKVPCLRCAKASFVSGEDDEPIGPQPCCRPRAGLKCFRCTRLHKYCIPILALFEAEIVALRTNPPEDVDVVVATASWTQRVTTFLRKANKEGEMLRIMRSLLHHTFELRNDIRAANHIGPWLPPSAKIIWPVMDGTEKDDKEEETTATRTAARCGAAVDRFLEL
ncbi:hypothetical protein ASPCAL14343 [Aspergillus calidoustus]|uniref:Uncharacterized protein n=1 Tax=Aspergillus calidoustus TaxID=454130 RepID=A0A0U5GJX1_ASPCI|nr:hypothetical protein ASPCAL14343 [Aspergillus calidoustus]